MNNPTAYYYSNYVPVPGAVIDIGCTQRYMQWLILRSSSSVEEPP